tara:strand:- start:4115 stop:4552 length:438 start_codon:yes stop_codon:yes gene_type:complete
MTILSFWMGKTTKQDAAKQLEVTPLRVWQLSQSALSGMLAGLLPQPRTRVPKGAFEVKPTASRASLEKRVRHLEAELSRTEDLVRVLRLAPWSGASTESTSTGGKTRAQKKKRAPKKKAAVRRTSPDRSHAPIPGDVGDGAGGDG